MPYTEMGKTGEKLTLITGHARRDKAMQFISLAHLLNKEYLKWYLKWYFYNLNRDKAVEIDGVSWKEYEKDIDERLGNEKKESVKYSGLQTLFLTMVEAFP